jgi:hypothetical protein
MRTCSRRHRCTALTFRNRREEHDQASQNNGSNHASHLVARLAGLLLEGCVPPHIGFNANLSTRSISAPTSAWCRIAASARSVPYARIPILSPWLSPCWPMCYNRPAVGHAVEREPSKVRADLPQGASASAALSQNSQVSDADPEDASRYCPVCSHRLESRRCKLICGTCGYYMSCADYY